MSAGILEQSTTGPVVQGVVPVPLPLPGPESSLSLIINAPGIHYRLEVPLADSPVVEDNKILARFILDEGVYLELNLTGQSIKQENKFEAGQFSLFYHIEERRPRAHFVADTLMAVIGLAGRIHLNISEPEVSTDLNLEYSLLEISKMLHRRQTAYRLMFIEEVTGLRFLLPSGIWDRDIAFVYHAIVDRSFVWSSGIFSGSIPATQENASLFAQDVQPFRWQRREILSEMVLGQVINLGRTTITIEDAVVKNRDKVREQLEARDGREVTLEIGSLSGQVKYEFTEISHSSDVSWEPKIQALIDMEPYLDAAITARYHALAASTLEGLTDEQRSAVTTRPELDEEAF